MQAKFASLSIVLAALFISQVVGAVPKIDCSLVRCAAVKWQVQCMGYQLPSAKRHKLNLALAARPAFPALPNLAIAARLVFLLQIVSAVQCLACPKDTVAVTVPGQCCPTCKPKPDCSAVQCLACVGVIEPGNCCPTCGLGADISKAEK
ncbi:hypothetical protein B0H14DRAFT_2605366 [Mycena olivaceomarginata]|nr:hypothetical protein B0H14DRAFT_2605366 [Mycena olivaceomarginata]